MEHTRTAKLPTMRLSRADLFSALSRLRRLVHVANTNVAKATVRESLTLSGEGSSVQLNLAEQFELQDMDAAPDLVLDVTYRYDISSYPPVAYPLSNVSLRLHDTFRELEVSGSSTEQIEALAALVSADAKKYPSYFAGFWFRSTMGVVLFVMGGVILQLAGRLPTRTLSASAVVLAILVQLSVWVLPWGRWLAGFATYPDSASALVRHAPLISFGSFVVGAIALILTVWQLLPKGGLPPAGP